MSSLHYSELCRLCLVNERVSIPIFDGESGIQSLCLKIGTCLPIKVSPEDILPKNICNDCFYKVENQYQFWISTANAEKQLLQWFSNAAPIPETDKGLAAMAAEQTNFKTEMDLDPSAELSKSLSQVEAVLAGETTNVPEKEDDEEEDESEEEGSNSDDSDYDGENAEGDGAKDDGDTDEAYDEELEPTTFVNVSFECDEAGPSGTQQQKQQRAPSAPSTSTSAPAPSGSGIRNSTFKSRTSLSKNTNFAVTKSTRKCARMQKSKMARSSDSHPSFSLANSNLITTAIDNMLQGAKDDDVDENLHAPSTAVVNTLSPYDSTSGNLMALGDSSLVTFKNKHSNGNSSCYSIPDVDSMIFTSSSCMVPRNGTFTNVVNLNNHSEADYGCSFESTNAASCYTVNNTSKDIYSTCKTKNLPDPNVDSSFKLSNISLQATENCQIVLAPEAEAESQYLLVVHDQEIVISGASYEKPTNSLECKLCHKQFKMSSRLDRHMITHSEDRPFACQLCSKAFKRAYELKVHVKTHTKEKSFVCEMCGHAFTQKHHLTIHRRRHTNDFRYLCDLCPKGFHSKEELQSHKNTQHNENQFVCQTCGRSCANRKNLAKHSLLHDPSISPKRHQCESCGKTFATASGLRLHKASHTGENSFPCNICGKVVASRDSLRSHKTIHSGVKAYVCDSCGKAFRIRENLRVHLRMHTGERPYQCGSCEKTFSRQSSLRVHSRNHTGHHAFMCQVCEKSFVSKASLQAHFLASHYKN